MTNQEMKDMCLHDTTGNGELYIVRVVGGWLYYWWDYVKSCPGEVGTFVPELTKKE